MPGEAQPNGVQSKATEGEGAFPCCAVRGLVSVTYSPFSFPSVSWVSSLLPSFLVLLMAGPGLLEDLRSRLYIAAIGTQTRIGAVLC